MDDLIRRSDAIKAMAKTVGHIVYDAEPISCHIMDSIPAVEPSEYADIAYGIGVCQGKESVKPCKDAVSREWLLDELEQMNAAFFYELKESTHEMYGQMKRMLRDAPSVTVEPKHGEWIYHEDYHTCSVCGVDWVFTDGTDGSDFCPNCGAKMKGADDADYYEWLYADDIKRMKEKINKQLTERSE